MNRRMVRALEQALVRGGLPRRRSNPLLWLYRWRYELGLLALLGGLVAVGVTVHWSVPVLVAAAVGVGALFPAVRAAARVRAHAVVIQHRLRTAFHEAGLRTWGGRLPAILWTVPRSAGVRVYVSCPAGFDVSDLQELCPVLAAACFAAEVRVRPHPRFANLAELLVISGPAPRGKPGSAGPRAATGEP